MRIILDPLCLSEYESLARIYKRRIVPMRKFKRALWYALSWRDIAGREISLGARAYARAASREWAQLARDQWGQVTPWMIEHEKQHGRNKLWRTH